MELKPFVTLSASHGARGSRIGPAVAAQLGVPFFDRAISAQVADLLGMSTDDPVLREQRPSGFLERMLANVAPMSSLYGVTDLLVGTVPSVLSEQEYRAEVDRVIRAAADGAAGGVLLGRAGAAVLAEHPRALHVRLDAPPSRRIPLICQEFGVDDKQAAKDLRNNDAAREAYVKQLYNADANDPGLYHLVLDSTAIPISSSIELIAMAALARNQQLAP